MSIHKALHPNHQKSQIGNTDPVKSASTSWSLCTKVTVGMFGAMAIATSVALYALSQDDENNGALIDQAKAGALGAVTSIALAGQALLTNAVARAKTTYQPTHSDELTEKSLKKKRVDQLHVPSPADEKQKSGASDQSYKSDRRSVDLTNRPLMFPRSNEYPLNLGPIDPSSVSAGYDSTALPNGNIAYVSQQANKIYVTIKDQDGITVVNKFLVSSSTLTSLNPTITTHNGNIVVGWSVFGNTCGAQQIVLRPTGAVVKPIYNVVSPYASPTTIYARKPALFTTNNQTLITSFIQYENQGEGYYDAYSYSEGFDTSYTSTGVNYNLLFNYYTTGSLPEPSTALASFKSSWLNMQEVFTYSTSPAYISAQSWSSYGTQTGYSYVQQASSPRAVSMANNNIFVTSLNPSGVLGFIWNELLQSTPRITICSTPAGDHDSHDLAASQNGTLIASHYTTTGSPGPNAFFKIFDQDGNQQGSAIQSNNVPNVSIPLINFIPNGNAVVNYLRNGSAYGRAFQLNAPPVLGAAIPPQNTTVNAPFIFQIPNGTWIDPNAHPLAYSATLTDSTSLPSWLSFLPNNRTFLGTAPLNSQGLVNMTVCSDDGFFNGIDCTSWSIEIVNRAPTLGQLPSIFYVGTPYSIQLPATDLDGDTLLFSGANLPSNAQLSQQGLLKWTPLSMERGSYPCSISVDDGHGGSVTKNAVWTVPNTPPIPSTITSKNFAIDNYVVYHLPTFKDNEGDDITYTLTKLDGGRLPGWAKLTGTTLEGTPQVQDIGKLEVNYTGVDGYGGAAWSIGEFNIVDAPTSNSLTTKNIITLASGIVAIIVTVFGCMYKVFGKRVDDWYERNIEPCVTRTHAKIVTCSTNCFASVSQISYFKKNPTDVQMNNV